MHVVRTQCKNLAILCPCLEGARSREPAKQREFSVSHMTLLGTREIPQFQFPPFRCKNNLLCTGLYMTHQCIQPSVHAAATSLQQGGETSCSKGLHHCIHCILSVGATIFKKGDGNWLRLPCHIGFHQYWIGGSGEHEAKWPQNTLNVVQHRRIPIEKKKGVEAQKLSIWWPMHPSYCVYFWLGGSKMAEFAHSAWCTL